MILNGSSLLIALYQGREKQTNQVIDHYKAEYFKEFQNVIKHLRGIYPAGTETSDVRQRLLSFSRQHGIGREIFKSRVDKNSVLGLSIWIAKEYTAKVHPMPDFLMPDFLTEQPEQDEPSNSKPQLSVSETVHKAKQGLLFE